MEPAPAPASVPVTRCQRPASAAVAARRVEPGVGAELPLAAVGVPGVGAAVPPVVSAPAGVGSARAALSPSAATSVAVAGRITGLISSRPTG